MSIVQNIKKTINYSKKNGYKEAACAAWERVAAKYYADYAYCPPSDEELEAQRRDTSLPDLTFSIAVPAYETNRQYMADLVESCLAQTYGRWELIIADGSESDTVRETVLAYEDARIKYVRLDNNGGIADNTNRAIAYASGDYCGLLDHDDMLTPDALYEMAKAIGQNRSAHNQPILVYSDEDKCDAAGRRFYDPHFKLDFNLDLILTNNYICHFLVIETSVLKKLGIRKEYDGSQDFDLALRVVSGLLIKEREGQGGEGAIRMEEAILHVPKALYHWRCHQNSTADNPQSKMYAYEAGKKALIDFTKRMGWKAEIRHDKHLGFYRIEYRNGVLAHRPDLAAVGGYVVKHGKIASGIYRGQPIFYAGYMNRMDLYQNISVLDLRNMAVNKSYQELYERVTGHAYESTLTENGEEAPLPDWIQDMEKTEDGRRQLEGVSQRVSEAFLAEGARLLLAPEYIRHGG